MCRSAGKEWNIRSMRFEPLWIYVTHQRQQTMNGSTVSHRWMGGKRSEWNCWLAQKVIRLTKNVVNAWRYAMKFQKEGISWRSLTLSGNSPILSHPFTLKRQLRIVVVPISTAIMWVGWVERGLFLQWIPYSPCHSLDYRIPSPPTHSGDFLVHSPNRGTNEEESWG